MRLTNGNSASMEPGHEDREYAPRRRRWWDRLPDASMEPGHEDREYTFPYCDSFEVVTPQWSPVMKTGNTEGPVRTGPPSTAMEPGHEDREYAWADQASAADETERQWSPVMKTGNTGVSLWESQTTDVRQWSPVMKTGNTWWTRCAGGAATNGNGARS